MSLPQQLLRANVHRLFIAYSYVYVKVAIEALEHSLTAEAVVIQPYEKSKSFASAKGVVDLYRTLRGDQGIPILFCPQGRFSKEGQFFEYGARLLDVLDIAVSGTRERIEQNRKAGKWVLQYGDDLYSTKNLLLVQAPIISLPETLSIGVATNILRRNPGERARSIAIPAPKLIDEKFVEVLQAL